jgi:hypothetical protein
MSSRRWVNPYQPQTLQIAIFLLYFRSAFLFLFGFSGIEAFALGGLVFDNAHRVFQLLVPVAGVAAGYGIANEKRWSYGVALAVAFLPLGLRAYVAFEFDANPLDYYVVGLMFDVALAALLLHPQSREYQRIWFK